jgi:glycosyltransferase involved in cell wall biosynthesis
MVNRSPQLRVGVPESHRRAEPASGWGRMWLNVLPELSSMVAVGYWENPRRSRFRQPPDVWLCDGHSGPLGVPEPLVIHLQEATWRHPSTRPLMRAKFIDQYERATECAVRIITPSESSRRQILDEYDHLDPAHVSVVPLGVNLGLFRPLRPGAPALIARAGGDPGRPFVLFVSTVQPRKNLPALRSAVEGLARRGLPHGLVVVATRPPDREKDDAEDLFAAAGAELAGFPGRVVLLRDVSDLDLAALMAGAAALCQPSLMEGFGLTPLEAMASGVPVVVSDRGSLPEVVGDAGVVSAPSAEALEEALYGVLTDDSLRERLIAAGLARSLQFSWRATAQGWAAVLQGAVPVAPLSLLERLGPTSGLAGQVVDYRPRLPIRRRRSSGSRGSAV